VKKKKSKICSKKFEEKCNQRKKLTTTCFASILFLTTNSLPRQIQNFTWKTFLITIHTPFKRKSGNVFCFVNFKLLIRPSKINKTKKIHNGHFFLSKVERYWKFIRGSSTSLTSSLIGAPASRSVQMLLK
jgi:hypothetical protein